MQDPFEEDMQALFPGHKGMSKSEKEARYEEYFKYDEYTATSTPVSKEFYNPAMESQEFPKSTYPNRYAEYVPGDTAIETLVDMSPLVEVGAGAGYWSFVINNNGGRCSPTDLYPQSASNPPETSILATESERDDRLINLCNTVWEQPDEKDAVTAIQENEDRPVLLCHPSGATRWSERVLDAVDAQPLIFVGQWFPGMDATPRFFERLLSWELTDTFPVFDTAGGHARGYIFSKE